MKKLRKIIREVFEQTDNFRAWFRDSKVVTPDGSPMVCYHQTQAKFDTFDISQSYSYSFWFTSDKSMIDRGETGASTRPGVPIITMPVFLSIQNMAGWNEYDKYGVGELIGMGFDGIKLDNNYVVFEPDQIKSATNNNGDYAPNNSNITK